MIYMSEKTISINYKNFVAMFYSPVLLDATLRAGDYIGFTFFTGYMSMLAASIFFSL